MHRTQSAKGKTDDAVRFAPCAMRPDGRGETQAELRPWRANRACAFVPGLGAERRVTPAG